MTTSSTSPQVTGPSSDAQADVNQLNRAMLDSIAEQVAVIDQHGTIVAANRAWQEAGLVPDPTSKTGGGAEAGNYFDACAAFITEKECDAQAVAEGVRSVLNGSSSHYQQLVGRDSGAGQRWFAMSAVPLKLGAMGAIITHADVSTQVETERELRTDRDRFARMTEVSPGVIHSYRLRPDGSCSFAYASPAIEEIYGLTPEQLRESGEPAKRAICEADRERLAQEVAEAKRTMSVWRSQFRVNHPRKGQIWVEGHSTPLREEDGSIIWHGFLTDITARKELEEQLHQSQKMEAIGRLAGGVAHDFNNLLTVVHGYCHVLLASLAEDDKRRDHVLSIRDAGERAARLTRQLLAFSRKSHASPQRVDLNGLLLNFQELLARLVGEDVVLSLELFPGQLPIQIDPAQLEQVIVNLAVNARDAMSNGGRLILRTDLVTVAGSGAGASPLLSPGRYAEMTVTDNGCGMSPEVQAKIFEPFFSTKPVGKGTGLGLSVVHGIITHSGGAVAVQTQLGAGSTFRIQLPLAQN